MSVWLVIVLILAVPIVAKVAALLLRYALSRMARRHGNCELCLADRQAYILNTKDGGPPLLVCCGCIDKEFSPLLKAYSLHRGSLVEMPK